MATESSANQTSDAKFVAPQLNGRTILYSPYARVDKGNILNILKDIKPLYELNKTQCLYLQNYRKGVQPILHREKKVRDDIKNIVIKNRANEIVNFKVGYLLGEPIQYVAREGAGTEETTKAINRLNDNCYLNKKSNVDKELADYMYTCGAAYRMVLPNPKYQKDSLDNPPFLIYALDPAFTAVVYWTGLGNKPILSIQEILVKDGDGNLIPKFCCYTETEYFEIVNEQIVKEQKHTIKRIPIIEYPLNPQRLGAFEPVITILDAINEVASNRVDAVEQTVQALMVFYNLEMDEESLNALKEYGAICLSSNDKTGTKQDVKYLNCDLNQDEAQKLIDDLENAVLTLCGMPNRNGGTSTSDTGTAVIMRDGWSDAEARAKQDELSFRSSEIDFLQIALSISNTLNGEKGILSIPNIDIRFTRKNYENISLKATVLTQMLGCDKIAPQLAFSACGLFPDDELAYKQSKEYYEELTKEKNGVINEERVEVNEETDAPTNA